MKKQPEMFSWWLWYFILSFSIWLILWFWFCTMPLKMIVWKWLGNILLFYLISIPFGVIKRGKNSSKIRIDHQFTINRNKYVIYVYGHTIQYNKHITLNYEYNNSSLGKYWNVLLHCILQTEYFYPFIYFLRWIIIFIVTVICLNGFCFLLPPFASHLQRHCRYGAMIRLDFLRNAKRKAYKCFYFHYLRYIIIYIQHLCKGHPLCPVIFFFFNTHLI